MVPVRRIFAPAIDFDALVAALYQELELPPPFTPQQLAQAQDAAKAPMAGTHTDHTDIPFVTIDPADSRDLDQAMSLTRTSHGYRVQYAIADVGAYLTPGSDLDRATQQRGQTMYLPDRRLPLHPPVLSEDGASLLPDQTRAAVVWTIDLDRDGGIAGTHVERALVRSRARYDYHTVQRAIDSGNVPTPLEPLAEIGALRIARGRELGAIELRLPEQEVERAEDGVWRLNFRAPLPTEEFNEQISLLTGEVAASIMLTGKVGVLRTLPPADNRAIARLRHNAAPLGVAWPRGARPSDVLATVDANNPKGAAFLDLAAMLLRGAGYTAFDGAPPEQPLHAGVGVPYAHVTAPLRRLVDRYATEVCLALVADKPTPDWARTMLPLLPDVMVASNRLANNVERAVLDYSEATMLAGRVGEIFSACVVDANNHNNHRAHNHTNGEASAPQQTPPGDDYATIIIDEPAIRARCEASGLQPGDRIQARLVTANPSNRQVLFKLA